MRLISAEKLAEILREQWCDECMTDDCYYCNIYQIKETIRNIPTVDAEPVTRCKDCESWGLNAIKKDEKGEVMYGDCLHFCCSTPKWFYCAWGERKNGQ